MMANGQHESPTGSTDLYLHLANQVGNENQEKLEQITKTRNQANQV
jgi:hypothetical protein